MSFADAAPIITALGGVGGIAAALRWLADRSERLRREDIARDDARADRSAARYDAMTTAMNAAAAGLTSLGVEVGRVPAALGSIDDRLDRMERLLVAIDARTSPPTGEHRAGVVS